jgi:hypothetical protein
MPLDELGHLGEERVREVSDDHAQDVRALLHKLPRKDVGTVAELVDRRPHSPPCPFGYP